MSKPKFRTGSRPSQLILDLPVFVPEQYRMILPVGGDDGFREYVFEWEEVNVQEMIEIMYNQQVREADRRAQLDEEAKKEGREPFYTPPKEAEIMRDHIYEFLKNHLVSGPQDRLRSDIDSIPLISQRQSLSLQEISDFINRRIKKNGVAMGWLKIVGSTGRIVHQQKGGVFDEAVGRIFFACRHHGIAMAIVRSVLRCLHLGSERADRQRKK